MNAPPPSDDESLTNDHGSPDPHKLEAMLARIRAKSEEFEAQLASEPQVMLCPVCQHGATLDVDASFKAQRATYVCEKCEEKKREQKLVVAYDTAGIPSDVRHATIENFQTKRPNVKPEFQSPEKFVAAAREFLVKGKRNIILAGRAGIGKGHLAAAIAIHFIKLNWRVAWVECARLFRDYHRAYEDGTNEEITHSLGTIKLLVIDEICLRDIPADGEEILFAILDRRHKEALPTVLIGNKPSKEIKAWLGERIVDRLRSGGVIFCYGEWDSMRGQATDGANENPEF